MKRAATIVAVLIPLAGLLSAPAVGSPARHAGVIALPRLLIIEGSNQFAVRPHEVEFLGDGSGILGRLSGEHPPGSLHWTSWTLGGANAHGTVWINDCKPDCAAGHWHHYAVKASAYRVRSGRYTRLRLRYAVGKKKINHVFSLQRLGPNWNWF